MASLMVKCPNCEYKFHSSFQEDENTRNVHTNCPKCSNSFEIDSNRI